MDCCLVLGSRKEEEKREGGEWRGVCLIYRWAASCLPDVACHVTLGKSRIYHLSPVPLNITYILRTVVNPRYHGSKADTRNVSHECQQIIMTCLPRYIYLTHLSALRRPSLYLPH